MLSHGALSWPSMTQPRPLSCRLPTGRQFPRPYRRAAHSAARHHSLRIVSELKTKGQRYNAEQLFLRPSGRPLGEGSFGEVFEVRSANLEGHFMSHMLRPFEFGNAGYTCPV